MKKSNYNYSESRNTSNIYYIIDEQKVNMHAWQTRDEMVET